MVSGFEDEYFVDKYFEYFEDEYCDEESGMWKIEEESEGCRNAPN